MFPHRIDKQAKKQCRRPLQTMSRRPTRSRRPSALGASEMNNLPARSSSMVRSSAFAVIVCVCVCAIILHCGHRVWVGYLAYCVHVAGIVCVRSFCIGHARSSPCAVMQPLRSSCTHVRSSCMSRPSVSPRLHSPGLPPIRLTSRPASIACSVLAIIVAKIIMCALRLHARPSLSSATLCVCERERVLQHLLARSTS